MDPHEPEQMGDQQGDQQGGQGVGPHDQGPEQGGHEVRQTDPELLLQPEPQQAQRQHDEQQRHYQLKAPPRHHRHLVRHLDVPAPAIEEPGHLHRVERHQQGREDPGSPQIAKHPGLQRAKVDQHQEGHAAPQAAQALRHFVCLGEAGRRTEGDDQRHQPQGVGVDGKQERMQRPRQPVQPLSEGVRRVGGYGRIEDGDQQAADDDEGHGQLKTIAQREHMATAGQPVGKRYHALLYHADQHCHPLQIHHVIRFLVILIPLVITGLGRHFDGFVVLFP
ncbi:hypothetical protein D3C86_923190 [compost metagenome]